MCENCDSWQIGDIVKISRNAERFWLKIVYTEEDYILAMVKNNVLKQPFEYGDIIEIKEDEIVGAFVE